LFNLQPKNAQVLSIDVHYQSTSKHFEELKSKRAVGEDETLISSFGIIKKK
jgi:hypothetical protein